MTNCICNTRLTKQQKLNLATKLADMVIQYAVCEQNGHQWKQRHRFLDDPTSYMIYQCTQCNIVRRKI